MCDPTGGILTGIALAAGGGASIFGAVQGANAQKQSARAIAEQNAANQRAQNQGFTQRAQATDAQTTAQVAAQKGTLADQARIAEAMRTGQTTAFQGQQDTLAALNEKQGGLRDIGYGVADNLMERTSGAALGQSQEDWKTQAARLLDASSVPAISGAEQPGGTGSDPYTQAALRRRAAEAATNIRSYGAKAAQVGSYAAPLQTVSNEVQAAETGIMPANMASKLLVSSAPVMFEPSEQAWRNAGRYGEAAIGAAQQQGQAALGLADLQYKNSTDIANLGQTNAQVTAANIAEQAKMDAAHKAAMAGVISSFGNLALQGAGYYGELPGFLKAGGTAAKAGSKIPVITEI